MMAPSEHTAELELCCSALPEASDPWHGENVKRPADSVRLALRYTENTQGDPCEHLRSL